LESIINHHQRHIHRQMGKLSTPMAYFCKV
jgi:hypothetical protein